MINLPDADAIIDALHSPLAPSLHALIAGRFKDAIALDLADMTHMLVVAEGDAQAEVVDAIGFDPLATEAPVPDWCERHESYYELVYCVGNSGFAFLIFVLDHPGVMPCLLAFCRTVEAKSVGWA